MRSARRKIQGFADESWEANEAGVIYQHDRKRPITNLINYLPTVDLGDQYAGPVPASGCAKDCRLCLYLGDPVNYPEPHPYRHRRSTLRLVEEVVLYAFRRPEDGWSVSRVHHLNGDMWDCSVENLVWVPIDAAVRWKKDNETRSLMKHHRSTRLSASPMGHYPEPYFTDSQSIPGHLPTSPKRTIGAA